MTATAMQQVIACEGSSDRCADGYAGQWEDHVDGHRRRSPNPLRLMAPSSSGTINFGDGTPTVAGLTASHTYYVPGNFTVTGTVTDSLGATASATKGRCHPRLQNQQHQPQRYHLLAGCELHRDFARADRLLCYG